MKPLTHPKPLVPPIRTEERDEQAVTSMSELYWMMAALLESLVLVGGTLWILNGSATMPLALRIALVAVAAVLGGVGFVLAAGRFKGPS